MDSTKDNLSPELLEKARLEVNEDWTRVPDQIKSLREKILEDPNRNFRTDDAFLLRFLRARKFDQERTLELMINYYTQRDLNPQFFRRTTSNLKAALDSNLFGVLPFKDSNGSSVLVLNSASHWDTTLFSFQDIVANITLSLERLLEDEEVQINGIVTVIDETGLGLRHVASVNPLFLKRTFNSLINAYPIRYKAIHFINEPAIFGVLFAVLKPFFKQKLLSRIQLHGSCLDRLHQSVSPDILPKEFGGHIGPFDNREWNRLLAEHETVQEENLKFGFANGRQ